MSDQHLPTRRNAVALIGAFLLVGACEPIVEPENGARTVPSRPPQPPWPSVGPHGRVDWSPSFSADTGPDPWPDPRARRDALPRGVGGVLRDHRGRTVSGVMVRAEPLDHSPGVPDRAVFTNARGRYHWALQPGRYRLSAESGGRRASAIVRVPERGQLRQDLTLH